MLLWYKPRPLLLTDLVFGALNFSTYSRKDHCVLLLRGREKFKIKGFPNKECCCTMMHLHTKIKKNLDNCAQDVFFLMFGPPKEEMFLTTIYGSSKEMGFLNPNTIFESSIHILQITIFFTCWTSVGSFFHIL